MKKIDKKIDEKKCQKNFDEKYLMKMISVKFSEIQKNSTGTGNCNQCRTSDR